MIFRKVSLGDGQKVHSLLFSGQEAKKKFLPLGLTSHTDELSYYENPMSKNTKIEPDNRKMGDKESITNLKYPPVSGDFEVT